MSKNSPEVDQYIASFPPETQKLLKQMRKTIRAAAPDAEEKIGYGIPTLTLNGNLVHYAAYKNHIGFYPAPQGLEEFKEELAGYKGTKGAVQFPLDKPLPLDLITKITKYRIEKNLEKGVTKKKAPAKTTKLSDSEQVSNHIKKLDTALGDTVEAIRQIILNTDKEIAEQIKWNNPSFYYSGEMKPSDPKEYKRDIVVMNLHKGRIMLVLPSGAKVNDTSGLLEGNYEDGRRTVVFKDLEDVKSKEKALQSVLKSWLSLVDK
ncbi:Uncharacterized conserved protein YdhG, YjbR/CyaY-like superfamily, DUF1801 family [Dyadobacter koreensis]|uniref:Uncharacterized conserved protein YdhG, YjbR/CyaY-like superfamily, DUF1801 family n=1 Tax=Dyadobacter koreensis TaxID=408657 RepID=A0A1H6WRS0_9BACT|nr:DUF1801 domain-containing protein [Dyadobacter koreensis]SEJ16947.1 Uncharacterized conserved protein YdhG, YjbR/CyaY-like superfamily, DUF1801 family [Dyadobacter koreensis]